MMTSIRTENGRPMLTIAILGMIALVVGANAHLVYVSLASQPDCVPHRRIGEGAASLDYAAASSSCSPSRKAGASGAKDE